MKQNNNERYPYASILDVPPIPHSADDNEQRWTSSVSWASSSVSSSLQCFSGKYRRSIQKHVGQQIARRRLLGGSSSSSSSSSPTRTNNNAVDQYEKDGSNLVFRRNAMIQDDWDTYEPYQNIEFFNQHDVIMASDKFGKIDIVKLPRYQSNNNNMTDNENDNQRGGESTTATRGTRPIGTLLAGKVELEQNNRSTCHLVDGYHVKMKGIQGGDAFVVGSPTGDYQVFATEHASTWGGGGNHRNHPPLHGCCKTFSLPVRQERISTIRSSSNGRTPTTSSSRSHPGGSSYTTEQSFVKRQGWNIPGPKRRFDRNCDDSKYSLQYMIRNQTDAFSLCYSMQEVDGWSSSSSAYYEPYINKYIRNDTKWDFRETSSCTLLAAHVDNFEDCFSLSVMDNRLSSQITNNNNSNNNNSNKNEDKKKNAKNVVCIDMTSKDNGFLQNENITSICFVSDHYLATAHEYSSDLGGRSTVKLWDIRMPTRATAEMPISTEEGKVERRQPVLPQFPYDHVYALDKPTSRLYDFTSLPGPLHYHQSGASHPILLSLCGSPNEGVDTVLLSSLTPDLELVHSLLDPSRMEVLPQQIRTSVQHSSTPYSVSITPAHDFVASFTSIKSFNGDDSMDREDVIKLYDWSQTKWKKEEREQQQLKSKKKSHNRKRSSRGEMVAEDNDDNDDKNPYLCGSIPSKLVDRHGTRSSLTCLALNDCGSAVVCGSDDGDLYLWRGG